MDMKMKFALVAFAAMFTLLICTARAGSITYPQDGSPILTNGSSSDPVSNLNADDANYYNIAAAQNFGPRTETRLSCKTDSYYPYCATRGGTRVACTCAQIDSSNNVYAGTGLRTSTGGTLGQVWVEANFSATTGEIPDDAVIQSANVTVEFRVSYTAANVYCYLEVWDGAAWAIVPSFTCTTTETTRTVDVSSVIDTLAKARAMRARVRYSTSGTRRDYLYVDLLYPGIAYVRRSYAINATHLSTANVFVPAGHALMKVEVHNKFKSSSLLPTYMLEWFNDVAWTTAGCTASGTVGGTDVDWSCTETANPNNAISANRIRISLSTNSVQQFFTTGENYVWYKIWFPNITSTSLSPFSDPNPPEDDVFEVNCTSGVDGDYGIADADYYLVYSTDGGGTWNPITTTSPNLQLDASTPTNPYTAQSISMGGSMRKNWNVVALAGSNLMKCVTNSTSAGEMNSSAVSVTVKKKPETNLTIWDETDSGKPYAGFTRYANDAVVFYANYTNASGSALSTASCNISIYNVSAWTPWYAMGFDAAKGYFKYNLTGGFNESGVYDWNVTCALANYQKKLAEDMVSIADRASSLAIWDETDAKGGGKTKYPEEQVKFSANYTGAGNPITDANCSIKFLIGSWTDYANMTYNSTTKLYEYNRSFASEGIYEWNVTCSRKNYQTQEKNDTVNITRAAFIQTDKTDYSNCGGVYLRVRVFNELGALIESNFTLKIYDALGVLVLNENKTTGNGGTGVYLGSYLLGAGAAVGEWSIKTLSCVVASKSFFVGAGSGELWKITIKFEPDGVRYNTTSTITIKFHVQNQQGVGVAGLNNPARMNVNIDGGANLVGSVVDDGAGWYSYSYDMPAGIGVHYVQISANNTLTNIINTRSFYVVS